MLNLIILRLIAFGEVINSVTANNCNEIDITKGETPECNADAEIMNIDPPDSNSISTENDGYQTQGRKRGRVPSNESIPSKKLTRSNSLPLQNKFNALANLPNTGNNQGPTNEISLTKISKIPPVTLKKPDNYRKLLKQINEKEGMKCNDKEAGEFVKLFCETPRDVRSLVEFLDKSNKEYFVIPGEVVKPIKIVIKGRPNDMDLEEIKTELVNKKFRVEKVNQLKKYKTREPLNIYQIHLFPSDNIKEIYHLTTLSYNNITVEPYENRQHHQCHNCQMWSHGSKNYKFKELKTLNKEIEELITDKAVFEADIETSFEYEEKLNDLKFQIKSKIDNFKIEQQPVTAPPVNIPANNAETKRPATSISLPKLRIPTFSGDASTFLEFINSFSNAIDSNESLNNVEKFIYLKSFLSGEAYKSVSGFSLRKKTINLASIC
ncbi:hypothetical protein AVEN_27621-1 [Araneus ventricosus]|uniref:Pre-C2HC domain-containing protein n=1 Tax=Araneus ventricosus TaxID=182803 RepID=A0A4Y2EN06_ARAVE|nr:hypothetical protein AVEN_27621-1 [Araneus ventricosus]